MNAGLHSSAFVVATRSEDANFQAPDGLLRSYHSTGTRAHRDDETA